MLTADVFQKSRICVSVDCENLACPTSSEAAVGFLLALALFTGLLLAAWLHSTQREKFSSISNVVARAPQSSLGNHIVLEKDEELKRNAENLIKRERQLEEEFLWLETFDKENIKPTKLNTVSVQEENGPHNRYIDIGNVSELSVNFNSCTQLPMTTTMSL